MIVYSEMKNRLPYLDYAKGFAILLMLFDHTQVPSVIADWIFAFHMPIFFIIAGMLKYYRNVDKITIEKLGDIIKRRIYQLGIPYLIFCILLAGYFSVMNLAAGQPSGFIERLFPIFTLQGVESMWFIPCAFFAEIILCATLVGGGKNLRMVLTLATMIFIQIQSDNMPAIWWQRIIVKFAASYSFAHVGYIIARYRLIEYVSVLLSLFILCVFSYTAVTNGHVGIGGLVFQNGLLFYMNAIMLSLSIISLFKASEKIKFTCWKKWSFFGKSSIVILCTNNLFIEVIRLADYKLTGNFCLTHGLFGNIVCFTILLLFEIPMIKSSHNKLAFVFGKKASR